MHSEEKLRELYEDIPEELDLLITHDAPYGVSDQVGYGGYYMFHMKAAESYPTGNEEMLTQSIGSYVANRTLQNWYADIKPDEAAMTAAKMQNDAATIHLLLTRREKPKNIFQDI